MFELIKKDADFDDNQLFTVNKSSSEIQAFIKKYKEL